MLQKKAHRRRAGFGNGQTLAVMALLVMVAVTGLAVSRKLLLDNARTMGKNLVTSYSNDEDSQLGEYERIVAMGMYYLEDMAQQNAGIEEIESWLADFFEKTVPLLDSVTLDAYAVVDGQVISAGGFHHKHEDYQSEEWYRMAMESEGEAIFTNAYLSPIHQEMVVTVAISAAGSPNAIAFDIPISHFRAEHTVQNLPRGGAYYVCDTTGELLYYNIPFEALEEELRPYVRDLFERVGRGELEGRDNEITGMQKVTRGLYYQYAQNGWLCILTVPYETLLEGVQNIIYLYVAAFALFLVVEGGMWLRERRLSRTAQRANETVQVLGNMYYAIYRINLTSGKYEATKGSRYVMEELPEGKGDYSELMQVILSSLDEWTREDFAQNFSLDNIRRLAEQKTTDFGGEFLRQFGDGQRWISVRLLMDEEQIPNEAVMCFRDVEEEKEDQLQQVRLMKGALSAAEQSEKSQKQFFSIMSHDMRTPLNIIIGMTGLALQSDCGREKTLDYLHKIGAASQQLLALINDILEISRLEQGSVSMEVKPFDLCGNLDTCLAPFRTQARSEGKEFQLSMDVKNRMVKGDPARFGQIVNNLLSNAMKFTRSGERISVSLRQVDEGKRNNYLFVVEDTGAGMSEEFLPKLFDPYEREVRFGAKETMGTGLGMPIVKNLVTRMGGQITVSSALGQGTTFTVTLPFDVGEVLPAPREEQLPVQDMQLEGLTILLAEDNFLNMEIATELLQMRGAQVVPAENGLEALDAFRASEPDSFDAILMDMQMPEMDGCQATEAIRALNRPDAKTIPIIALTANAFAEDISRTTQAGMDAHLAKPINIELLCSTMTKLVRQRSLHRNETHAEKE